MLLREGQGDPAIAGADEIGFFQFDAQRVLDRARNVVGAVDQVRIDLQDAGHGAAELVAHAARRRPVFYLDDRFIVGVEQDVVRRRRILPRRHRHGRGSGSRRCRGRSPTCAPRREHRDPGPRRAAPEHFVQRLAHLVGNLGRTFRLQLAEAGFLEVAELFQELHQAEVPFQRAAGTPGPFAVRLAGFQRAAKQGEAAVDARFLAGDARRGGVVGAGIGDAAPDDVAVFVEQHGFRRCRAEVDADERAHGFPLRQRRANRRVSARSSGNSFPGGS